MSGGRAPGRAGRAGGGPGGLAAVADAGRRLLGLLLLALVAVPVYLILDPGDFVGSQMRTSGGRNWRFTWGIAGGAWSLPAVGLAAALGWMARGRVTARLAAVGAALARPRTRWVALAAGLLGAGLAAWASLAVFDGRPTLTDASVQLVQARYFAAGKLSGPVLPMPEFWSIQFMVLTASGWVSQYPPAHALVLAGGFALGAPWIAMVVLMGLMGALLVPAFERLLPDRAGVARLAALAAAATPLLAVLAGAYMNHATVAALAALALYAGLRAEEGGPGWAALAGAAVGAMVTTRPVSGLLIGSTATAALWLFSGRWRGEGGGRGWLLRRLGAWAAGGLPFAIGFGWFNARFFGSPFRLGYVAASGPNHGLGFHEDPWGRVYGPDQALGYTSAELLSLGRDLLGAPLPLVALIGLFLLVARRLSRGERLLVAWAVLPVLASALYWHHDLVYGARMLGGAAPAWAALAVLAAVELVRRLGGRRLSDALAIALLAAVCWAAGVGWRERVERPAAGGRLRPVPEVSVEGPSLVFVHEPWGDRLGGRLAARGLRLDSVRTLLGRFDTCELEAALAGRPVSEITDVCVRERDSDAGGASSLLSTLWMGDLPGLERAGPMWVRDLGPESNARLLDAHPDRVPLFLLPPGAEGRERVVPYERGVALLWGNGAQRPATNPWP